MRTRARAYIVVDPFSSGDLLPIPPTTTVGRGVRNRFAYILVDAAYGDTAVRQRVLAGLHEVFPGVYGEDNVALVGTSSHSGTGGFVRLSL